MTAAFSVTDEEWWWGEPDYPDAGWARTPVEQMIAHIAGTLGMGFRQAIVSMNGVGKSLHAYGMAQDVNRSNPHENHLHIGTCGTSRGYASPSERRKGDQNYLRITQKPRRVR